MNCRKLSKPLVMGIVCTAAVTATGCATVVHGDKERVAVVTEPSGAVARFDSQSITTPGELVLPRKPKTVTVTIEKEGYEP